MAEPSIRPEAVLVSRVVESDKGEVVGRRKHDVSGLGDRRT
jgi:hypothetical protein